jgi:monoamine oxidase
MLCLLTFACFNSFDCLTVKGASLSNKRIVVIGGGIAGLAATHRLIQKYGIADVVLFEADLTAGGRCKTIQIGKNTPIMAYIKLKFEHD